MLVEEKKSKIRYRWLLLQLLILKFDWFAVSNKIMLTSIDYRLSTIIVGVFFYSFIIILKTHSVYYREIDKFF